LYGERPFAARRHAPHGRLIADEVAALAGLEQDRVAVGVAAELEIADRAVVASPTPTRPRREVNAGFRSLAYCWRR